MASGKENGYQVAWQSLRKGSARADDRLDLVEEQYSLVNVAFLTEGNPLGDDQYGAELERRLPKLEDDIYRAFDDYLYELRYMRDGLQDNARTYEDAEDPWGEPYVGSEEWPGTPDEGAQPGVAPPSLSEEW
ncbi:hypothetical protein [Nonomuraea sp. GTA35]|uniref:hypothetical protein n=1 Tax=Nonomuraea sp. GTA35 TaxID=1676746 RepID=UPI0035C1336F